MEGWKPLIKDGERKTPAGHYRYFPDKIQTLQHSDFRLTTTGKFLLLTLTPKLRTIAHNSLLRLLPGQWEWLPTCDGSDTTRMKLSASQILQEHLQDPA